jgi:hypothetical protein
MIYKQLIILSFTTIAIFSNCYSQDLLYVDWQKIICSNNTITAAYSTCSDNKGNTYTLGRFSNNINCLGANLSNSTGGYFITKQNSKGEKLLVKNLGSEKNLTFGEIKVCRNGDLVLGLNFRSTFYLNEDSITHSLTHSSIILKIDENFNLKWFKVIPASKVSYTRNLIIDNEDNIYTSIAFFDSISINDKTYSQKRTNTYGTLIAKLSLGGNVLWSHHYSSENTLIGNILKIKKSCNSCPATLFVSGSVSGDSIYIDGVLKNQNKSKYNSQLYVATLNEYGDILQTKFLDDGIRSIADIEIYQNRIFFAGAYIDTVNWNNTYVTPNDYSSICIGELSEQANLIGFADLQSNKTFFVNEFKISPQYGFLISGSFNGSFSLQSSSMTLDGSHSRGSFIASINETLKLNDCKYIKGGNYNLQHLSVSNNQIIGVASFRGTCYFQNQSCSSWYDDISTFQTSDIKTLKSFNPPPFPNSEILSPFSTQVYPNPFRNSFQIKFSEPIYSTSLIITNSIGQICKDIFISQINDTEFTYDATGLPAGLYIVHYLTCNNSKATSKLIKIN